VKSALGYEFVELTRAVFAFCKRFVRKILQRFFNVPAFGAFIFVDWHLEKSP
jgi:hypothetical protein